MSRIPTSVVLLAVACAAVAQAREKEDRQEPKAKIEDAKRVLVPIFDPDTGKRMAVIEAVTVTPDPKNPQHLRATDVRILAVQDTKEGKKTHVIHGKVGVFDMTAKMAHLQRDVVIIFDDAEAEKDRTRVYSDDMLWNGKTGTAKTDGPVRVERPDMTITGVGMTVYRGERQGKTPKPAPAKGAASPTAPQDDPRVGNVVIHRHEKTTVRPDKGQWLVPMADAKPSDAVKSKPKPVTADAAKKSPPIVITSAGPLTIDRGAGMAIYKHNVRAVQGPQSLTSDELRLGFADSGQGDAAGGASLSRVVAIGHVRMDDGDTFALADHATWTRDTNSLVLVGRPAEVRWDNGNRITAGTIRRLNNGEILHCTQTDEHPGNAFLMIYSAQQQAEAHGDKTPAVPPGSSLPTPLSPPLPVATPAR